MFSRKSTENQTKEEQITEDIMKTASVWENQSLAEASQTETQNPEIVNIVEKISTIISPYFIAIVGLYLYDRNLIIGFFLITIGIISLLKITLKDLDNLVTNIKNFFS